jgi:integrase/recombinase XerD
MPRRPSLEPRPTKKRHAPWVVNLPPALGGTGKRERRYFDTQKAAKEFCKQQRIRLENYGTASTLLPAGKIEEAQTAFDRLSPFGISLLAAVDHYLEWRKNQEQTVTFKGLFEKFIESKADRSQPYRTALHYTLPRFPTLHDRLAFDIAPGEIEDALVGLSQSVRNAFLRNIRAAFNFGIRRGWCEKNPVSRIEMEPLKPRRKILTNPQVEALLAAAVKEDIELLPYLLFCIFAGIRPQEVERLEWSNVNLDEGHVVIPEEASKTDTRRVVEMEPLLRRWLSYFIERRGEQTGAIIVTSNFRKRLRAIRKAAGLEIWPQDAPRRTYASCWLAIHEKVDRLNYFMGHTSPAMLYRHYHRAVTLNQAKEFWEIEPPRSPKKRTPRKKRT